MRNHEVHETPFDSGALRKARRESDATRLYTSNQMWNVKGNNEKEKIDERCGEKATVEVEEEEEEEEAQVWEKWKVRKRNGKVVEQVM